MERIKRQLRCMLISFFLAAFLCTIHPEEMVKKPLPVAWWGSLYPKFCFGKICTEEKEDMEIRPKISFYLAKLFDW